MVLDGVTFEVIVHRITAAGNPLPSEATGEWLVRVYVVGEHVYSIEGGVSLDMGMRRADRAMREYLEAHGAE